MKRLRFMRAFLCTAAVLALPLAFAGSSTAQDASRPTPWALTFSHGPLDVITVHYKDGSARPFYYLTFQVKNESKTTADLSLNIEAKITANRRSQTLLALPHPDAEEAVRRLSRTPDLMSVQEINRHDADHGPGKLKPGQTLRGIAVFGTFDRGWDTATITVAGLEPRAIETSIRKYAGAGYTVAHRGYIEHNAAVMAKVKSPEDGKDDFVILQHNVVWKMIYHRRGDEFAPQLDPIHLGSEGWTLMGEPKIVMECTPTFSAKASQ